MASKGTPTTGLALIAARVYGSLPYTLVAYTNAQGSLGPGSVLADLAQPDQANGYAPIVLPAVGWTFSGGVASYAHPSGANNSGDGLNNPCWYATGAWSADVTGAAMIDPVTGTLQHFVDALDGQGNPAPFTAKVGGKWAIDISNLASSP